MKWNVEYPNDEKHAAQELKAPDLNRRATFRGIACPWKVKRWLLKKLMQKTRHHVLWVTPCHTYYNLAHPLTWTLGSEWWPWVDRQRQSCLVPTSSSRPWIGHQRSPYLVPNDAAMASSWLSVIVILAPHKITTTSSWLWKSSHAWSRMMRQWP